MKVLIIGEGQIGSAIKTILSKYHEVFIRDLEDFTLSGVDYLHICYPDSLLFVKYTRSYIEQYKPKATVIHSSIGIGKTEQCGESVVHVPVRGRHPYLADEIPAYPLFIGGKNKAVVEEIKAYLEGCGLVAASAGDPKGTELIKLLSNIHMGLEIAWRQEVGRLLEKFNVHPLVYERWEESYNEGYRMTGNEQLIRPRLNPDPIGGHCILECTDILSKQAHSKLFDFIVESNEKEKTKRSSTRKNGTPETVAG